MELLFIEINVIVINFSLIRERRIEFQNLIFDSMTKFDS